MPAPALDPAAEPAEPSPSRPPTGGRLARLSRFAAVSAVAAALSQAVLVGAQGWFGWPGATANLAGVAVSVPTAFGLNRRLVWAGHHLGGWWRQAGPFALTSLVGALLSTVAVGVADARWHNGAAVSAANLAAFGSLWGLRFAMLDRMALAGASR